MPTVSCLFSEPCCPTLLDLQLSAFMSLDSTLPASLDSSEISSIASICQWEPQNSTPLHKNSRHCRLTVNCDTGICDRVRFLNFLTATDRITSLQQAQTLSIASDFNFKKLRSKSWDHSCGMRYIAILNV